MEKLKKRSAFLLLTIVVCLGISLAAIYYVYVFRDSRENKLSTGMISVDFKEKSNTIINLTSNVPVIDDVGLDNTPYEFTVTNTSNTSIDVDIKVDVDSNTSINLGALRYGIYIDDKLVKKDYIHNDLILYTYEELLRDESINCKIKFWVDYYYDKPNEKFIGKIKVEGKSSDKLYNGVTVTFDKGNLVYGLDNIENQVGYGMTYSILDGTVEVTANKDDGSGYTTGRVYLESGKTYVFNCSTNGVWGGQLINNGDSVEAFLMLNGLYPGTFYHMESNNNFEFTPSETGIYWLRLDVNTSGKQYRFWDISVVEKDTSKETKEVGIGETYGKLPTPVRDGYTFMGWNGKNYYNYQDVNLVSNGVTSDNNGWIAIDTSSGASFYNYWTHNLNILENESYTIIVEIKNSDNITGYLGLTSQNNIATQFNDTILRANMLISNSIYIYDLICRENAIYNYGLRTFYGNSNSNTNEKLTFRISVLDIDDSITENNFEYEPYYITSSTKVVQKQNHTLKAIWKKNS